MIEIPKQINELEVCAMMGMKLEKMDAVSKENMKNACEAVLKAASPRYINKRVSIANLQHLLIGNSITKHLEKCHDCEIIGVTLGVQTDVLLRTMSATNISVAVWCDAVASVLIEQMAENVENHLREELLNGQEYLTQRFSPGYGDFPITVQNEILNIIDAQRKIGLTATQSHILTPRKSITAICGIARVPVKGALAGCSTCALRGNCHNSAIKCQCRPK